MSASGQKRTSPTRLDYECSAHVRSGSATSSAPPLGQRGRARCGRPGARPDHLIREAFFAHSEGDDDSFLGPVERDSAAKLSGHTPVH